MAQMWMGPCQCPSWDSHMPPCVWLTLGQHLLQCGTGTRALADVESLHELQRWGQ